MFFNPVNVSEYDVIMHVSIGISGLRKLNFSDLCLIALYALISVLSLGGNGLFLYLSIRYRGLRRHISYIMVNLAGSNLLVTCFCIPASAIRLFYLSWQLGAVGCKLVMFVEGLAFSVNSFSLAAIAIIRARQSAAAVLVDRAVQTTPGGGRGFRFVAAAIWAGACVASIPALFAVSLEEIVAKDILNLTTLPLDQANRPVMYLCSEFRRDPAGRSVQKAFSAYFLFMLFLSPCVVLSFSYGFTARFITRQFARLASGQMQRQRPAIQVPSAATEAVASLSLRAVETPFSDEQYDEHCRLAAAHPTPAAAAAAATAAYHARELQQRTVRTVVVLVAVFFVCWFPKDLIIVMQDFVLQDRPTLAAVLTDIYPYSQALIYLHSAACPFLYWCLSRVFQRYAAKALFCRSG